MNNMTHPRHILGATLIICWALLLGARCLAAATYGSGVGKSYEIGLERIGWLLPASAWASLAAGLFLSLCPGVCSKSPKDGDAS